MNSGVRGYVPPHPRSGRSVPLRGRFLSGRPRQFKPELGVAHGHACMVHVPVQDAAPEEVGEANQVQEAALIAPVVRTD